MRPTRTPNRIVGDVHYDPRQREWFGTGVSGVDRIPTQAPVGFQHPDEWAGPSSQAPQGYLRWDEGSQWFHGRDKPSIPQYDPTQDRLRDERMAFPERFHQTGERREGPQHRQQIMVDMTTGESKMVEGQPKPPSDFALTMHAATRGMSDEDRTAYLSNFRNRLAERLQRYEWRLTRGIPLSKEQNALYKKLLEQLQTISEMMETPERISQYAEGTGAPRARLLGAMS